MIDVSAVAGFPLRFDPDTLATEAGEGFVFREKRRSARAMGPVLDEPIVTDPQVEAYRTYLPERFPEPAATTMAQQLITYSLVAVPAARFGREAAKTFGHIHGPLPGSRLTTPEVYAQLYGRLVVMLQRHDPSDIDHVYEYVTIELDAGAAILIPPGWAHSLANPFGEAGLLAGLYAVPERFPADYAPMERRRGMAWRVLPAAAGFEIAPNPAYSGVPASRIDDVRGTVFETDPGWLPLWSAAAGDPATFRFLAHADEARARFGEGEEVDP